MEKLVEKVMSVICVILGVCWEALWIHQLIVCINSNSIIKGQYAVMCIGLIVGGLIVGIFELYELIRPFKED